MATPSPLDSLSPEQRRVLASLTPAQRAAFAIPGLGVRRRATQELFGLPLYMVALGPDLERGELRGHAKAIIAIGDLATGVIAVGGWARGLVAIGGLATGVVGIGGLAVGLAGAFGGLALSLFIAMGGGAVGTVAIGGGAVGQYALGGAAVGEHCVSGTERDPEAVRFFSDYGWTLPGGRP